MGVSTYTPTGISHATSVDFSKRTINQPVHLVQYDKSLPILAVSLYNNGQLYPVPDSSEINIRVGKPDKTFVYKSALGCNANRTIAYFEITQQMTVIPGEYYPVIEIVNDNKIACSSSIYIIIDKNPIQEDYIESKDEFVQLVQYRDEAKKYAEEAKSTVEVSKKAIESAIISEEAAKVAVQARDEAVMNAEKAAHSADAAKKSETNTKASEENTKSYETNAKESEVNAKESEINAKESESNAANSALNASKSESNTKESEVNAKESEFNAANSALNASKSESNAKESEVNAKISEDNAEEYGNLSKSYAIGTNNAVRVNDQTDNAKYYSQKAKEYADKASEVVGGDFIPNSAKGIAGGVATLDDNLAVAKAVADDDGNSIKDTYATREQLEKHELDYGLLTSDGDVLTASDDDNLLAKEDLHQDTSKFLTQDDIDSTVSPYSVHAVQNRAVAKALEKKVDTSKVANNFTTTAEGFVADARTIKTLNDSISGINDSLEKKQNTMLCGTFLVKAVANTMITVTNTSDIISGELPPNMQNALYQASGFSGVLDHGVSIITDNGRVYINPKRDNERLRILWLQLLQ